MDLYSLTGRDDHGTLLSEDDSYGKACMYKVLTYHPVSLVKIHTQIPCVCLHVPRLKEYSLND